MKFVQIIKRPDHVSTLFTKKFGLGEYLDQLYAAFPSDSNPSLPVDTVAFSKCLMLIDERAEVTIIKTDNQSFRSS